MARERDDDYDGDMDDDYDDRPRRGRGSRGADGAPPPNYLVQSILVTLCCCLPLGIVSIVYATQVNSKWQAGDSSGALEASANAKKWSTIGFVTGIVTNIIGAIIQFAVLGAANNK